MSKKMDKVKMKHLNPITVDAEIFLNSLESLSRTCDSIDIVMLQTLEKIVDSIEKIMNSAAKEIIETEKVALVRLDNVSKIKRIFSCTACKTDIGKSVENVALHLSENCNVERQRLGADPRENQLQKTRKELRVEKKLKKEERKNEACRLTKKTYALLTSNLIRFIEDQLKIGAKMKILPAYDDIEKELFRLIAPQFPKKNVKIYKFGSRLTGIGHPDSDLDLYIDIGDTFHIYQNRASSETILKMREVQKVLERNPKWKCLISREKARVPILKVIHTNSGIECDINFSNSLGIINTQLLEYIFNLQPITQLLCCFMKKWISRLKLNELINTYSMNLLVIFCLQTMNLVPSIKRLQEENIKQEKLLKVGHWTCTYSTLTREQLNLELVRLDQPNLLKYIRTFFNFYIGFNFSRDIICPYLGKKIRKTEIEKLMPNRYKEFVKSFPEFELQLEKPIVVQDPIQLNHNTTKSVPESCVKNFKLLMLESVKTLNSIYLEEL